MRTPFKIRIRNTALSFVSVLFAMCFNFDACTALAQDESADSLRNTTAVEFDRLHLGGESRFDSIPDGERVSRRSWSLGHYLETLPGVFVERRGPVGADARFSRYGIGSARGSVYLGRVRLNDPQNGFVPLAIVPTSALGYATRHSDRIFDLSGNEGVIHIYEMAPNTDSPRTAFDVATGGHGLNERRFRFSSAAGGLGIDLSYDELENDGYQFDIEEALGGQDFGRSRTRGQGLNIRGELVEGEEYLFAYRRFTSTFQGDLRTGDAEQRRSGYYGLVEGRVGLFELAAYQRGYKLSVADSLTRNQSTTLSVRVPLVTSASSIVVGAEYEDIVARQQIGSARSDDRLEQGSAFISGSAAAVGGTARLAFGVSRQFDLATGWGGEVGVYRPLTSRHSVAAELKQSFRLPNLGELFQPAHSIASNTTLQGNRGLDAEKLSEATIRIESQFGSLTNELRATVLHTDNPILIGSATFGSAVLLSPQNFSAQALRVLDDRFRIATRLGSLRISAGGGVEVMDGDRAGYFRGVPGYRLSSSLEIGRAFFKNTSDFRLTADYVYTDERQIGSATLAAFKLLNVRLDWRLVDAVLYASLLNALDESYETVDRFLMSPRTLMLGISWTFFD